eukprot:TRINITY_DN18452_c0_g1_i3.p1 TRINITY_DN18452_c0_g1~~TRINITY_DN18452_c0_g1_i3.p1  ORF type:complete len:126 (+),score=20.49 TRINITY_DN18452_c0_g1_i3:139-516(+)
MIFRLIILGDPGVGKTSVLSQFEDGTFTEYHSAIESRVVLSIPFGGKQVMVQFRDAFTEKEKWHRNHLDITYEYQGFHGALVVYDVTNSDSFKSVKFWMIELDREGPANINKILIGNKCDLSSEK